MNRPVVVALLALASGLALAADAPSMIFTKMKDIKVPGQPTAFDGVSIEPTSRRLYAAHSTKVEVFDVEKGERIGFVGGFDGARHALAVPALKKGFATGGKDQLIVFDLAAPASPTSEFKKLGTVEATGQPDALLYIASLKELWVVCHADATISCVDPDKLEVKSTITGLGGKLNSAVEYVSKGLVFVCAAEKDVIYMIDVKKHAAITKRDVSPHSSPTGLAIDEKTGLLFCACKDKLVVLDAMKSNIVAAIPIAERCNAVAFDAAKGLIYAPSSAGTMTVVRMVDPKTFAVVATVETAPGGATCALDPKKNAVWVPVGTKFEPAVEGEPEKPQPEHRMLQFVLDGGK